MNYKPNFLGDYLLEISLQSPDKQQIPASLQKAESNEFKYLLLVHRLTVVGWLKG